MRGVGLVVGPQPSLRSRSLIAMVILGSRLPVVSKPGVATMMLGVPSVTRKSQLMALLTTRSQQPLWAQVQLVDYGGRS